MGEDLEVVWMTYDEAAKALRIKPDSVRRRAASRKWPRQLGNDRLARVGIPRDIIPDVIADITPDNPDVSEGIRGQLQDALTKIRILEAELKAAKAAISSLDTRLDEARTDRDAWKDQANELAKTQSDLVDRLTNLTRPKPGIFRRIFRQ